MRIGRILCAAVALLAPTVTSQPDPGTALYTNAVTYCAEAKAVLIDQFDIAYWKQNNSVTFSFSFASVQENLNVSANLYLNDYGNQLFNETIDICSILSGVLCPLPQVNFTGFGTLPLPEDLITKLPGLAWTVPNLEAYARIQLIDKSTNEVAACLQATLSNGWSTQLYGVKWAAGGLTLAAGLIAIIHAATMRSPSPAQYRWFDLLYLFQSAGAAGLMHLNYPLVFSQFTQNFAWALGLFFSEQMQSSISKMRHKTGGKMSDSAFSDVQYINRKLSPYNVLAAQRFDLNDVTSTPAKLNSFIQKVSIPKDTLTRRGTIPSLIDQIGANGTTTGIPVYVNSAKIPLANAYNTIFFWFLAFIAIVLAFHAVLFAVVFLLSRGASQKPKWAHRLYHNYWSFCCGNMLRACLVFFFPIFTFGFYQWTIGKRDSGLSIFWAIFGIIAVAAPLLTAFVLQQLRGKKESYSRPGISRLYTDFGFFHKVGVLYRPFRAKYHFWWFAPQTLAMIARAAFIGFGQSNAWAQVIGCLLIEFILFVTLIVFRPHVNKKGDFIAIFLAFCRMALFGLLVAFIESVGMKGIPRTVVGIVLIAVVGIPTVVLLISLIYNTFYGFLWHRHPAHPEEGADLEHETSSAATSPMRETDGFTTVTDTRYPSSETDMSMAGSSTTPLETPVMEQQRYAAHGLPFAAQRYSNGNAYGAYTYDQPQYGNTYGNGYAAEQLAPRH